MDTSISLPSKQMTSRLRWGCCKSSLLELCVWQTRDLFLCQAIFFQNGTSHVTESSSIPNGSVIVWFNGCSKRRPPYFFLNFRSLWTNTVQKQIEFLEEEKTELTGKKWGKGTYKMLSPIVLSLDSIDIIQLLHSFEYALLVSVRISWRSCSSLQTYPAWSLDDTWSSVHLIHSFLLCLGKFIHSLFILWINI